MGVIAITTLFARVVGFGRWIVFSGTVGSTCVGEVYSTANLLPNVLFEVAAGGALAAVAVPLVAGALARGERDEADQVASALLTWALAVLVPLALLLAVLARPVATLLLSRGSDPGCSGQGQVDLATTMILIFAPQIPLYGVGIVLAGVLQSHRRFLAAALAPLMSSLVVIASYLAYARLARGADGVPERLSGGAVAALAGGTTLGVVALSLPLLLPVRRSGARLRPSLHFPPGAARRAGHLAGAGVLALLAQQVAVLCTTWVANHRGGTGTLNVYTYVQAVYLLPYAVLAVPVATAAFPNLVNGSVDRAAADDTLVRSLRLVLVVGGLGSALLVAVARPVGRFFVLIDASKDHPSGSAISAMTPALVAYGVGLAGFAVIALLQRALYVRGVAWHGAVAIALGWLVAAVAPLLLVGPDAGARSALTVLGWSSSVGMYVAALALAVLVARSWGASTVTGAARTAAAAALAGVVAAVVGSVVARLLSPGPIWATIAVGAVAAAAALIAYATVLLVADPSSARLARRRLRRGGRPSGATV
ncbi:murein biosynthesis integral membrane protein MurJ [Luteipulveratus flavus]|uniref:Lipid II flippase MurJ n=1 Tax=Luteipulveratus flavus TaxID=3031728 RepID=A0ABT6C797_9MICO|nr:lipid II flippase MurJ [Luteipulveratus sp. YIM 133296]MDF8264192.1 lipid II flippase MurJ [Luteipulveratus sp. YIM 133296]